MKRVVLEHFQNSEDMFRCVAHDTQGVFRTPLVDTLSPEGTERIDEIGCKTKWY